MDEYDKEQAGTPYWNHITWPELQFEARLVALLKTYRILVTGKEFIMACNDTILLIDELQEIGIAVDSVGVWCFVPKGQSSDDCCEDYSEPIVKGNGSRIVFLCGIQFPIFPVILI